MDHRGNEGFPDGTAVKNPPASAGDTRDTGLIPGSGRSPGKGNGNLFQYSWHGKFHGQRSLVGYSPCGCKESDTSEQLNTHTHTHTHTDNEIPEPSLSELSVADTISVALGEIILVRLIIFPKVHKHWTQCSAYINNSSQ